MSTAIAVFAPIAGHVPLGLARIPRHDLLGFKRFVVQHFEAIDLLRRECGDVWSM